MEWIVCSEWDWPLSTCRCEECEGEGFVQVWLDEYDSFVRNARVSASSLIGR